MYERVQYMTESRMNMSNTWAILEEISWFLAFSLPFLFGFIVWQHFKIREVQKESAENQAILDRLDRIAKENGIEWE